MIHAVTEALPTEALSVKATRGSETSSGARGHLAIRDPASSPPSGVVARGRPGRPNAAPAMEHIAGGYGPQGPERRTMRVIVDHDLCTSIGTCMRICPEVFEVSMNKILYVLQERPPESLRPQVEEAVEMCPMGAIRIED